MKDSDIRICSHCGQPFRDLDPTPYQHKTCIDCRTEKAERRAEKRGPEDCVDYFEKNLSERHHVATEEGKALVSWI